MFPVGSKTHLDNTYGALYWITVEKLALMVRRLGTEVCSRRRIGKNGALKNLNHFMAPMTL